MNDRRIRCDRREENAPVNAEHRVQSEQSASEDRRVEEDRRAHCGAKKLHAYQSQSSGKKRDETIKQHLKLVSYVASRLAIGLPSWVDKRDLVNAGVIGLIDAINNYDPSKGVKFETYAVNRIKGAMLDELRALDWIPRSTRAKSREIETVIAALIGRLGRFPNDMEIARELKWDMTKYYKTIDQVSGTTLLSLDELIDTSSGGEPVKRIDTLSNESSSILDTMEHRELLENVVKVLQNLSEQERLTISLYYYEELTLKEIGQVMNVSESRVSQIHTSAVLKLRAKLRIMYGGS
jgi:RNA polymerase sigma factor for flagellar operon FliA